MCPMCLCVYNKIKEFFAQNTEGGKRIKIKTKIVTLF
jgi:hypothetical protein